MPIFFQQTNPSLEGIVLVECDSPAKNKIFRDTVNAYHSYVKYKSSPTRNIRWLVYENGSGNLVGAIGISSATIALLNRDTYIGWDNETRIKNLGKLANNSRFCLIRKNFTVKNVGSMTLKQLRIKGSIRWKEKYGEELLLLETFVQPERNEILDGYEKRNGSIYLSDNWINIGLTSGNSIRKAPTALWKKENSERGKLARENPALAWEKYGYGGKEYIVEKSPQKIIFIKPLVFNWKRKLLS